MLNSILDESGDINFLYRIKIQYGFALYLVGSASELGNWNTSNAIRLDCYYDSVWIKKIHFKNIENVEYKYFISNYELNTKNINWIEIYNGPMKNFILNKEEFLKFKNKNSTRINSKNINDYLSPQNNLSMMSYNILYDNNKRGAIYSWEKRKTKIINLLNVFYPDIVGFQEALPNQAYYIQSSLKNVYNYIGIGRNADFTGEQNGILFNKFKFDIINSGTFWLSETPDIPGSNTFKGYFPRIATWVRLRDIEDYYFKNYNKDLKRNFNELYFQYFENDKKNEEGILQKFKLKIQTDNFMKDMEMERTLNYKCEKFLNDFYFYLEKNMKNFVKNEILFLNTHYDHISEQARINSSYIFMKKIEELLKIIYLENEIDFKNFRKIKETSLINKKENHFKIFGQKDIYDNNEKTSFKNINLKQNIKDLNILINDYENIRIPLIEKVNVFVILTGDFNADDSSKEIKVFKKALFTSLSDVAKNSEKTFHDYSGVAFSKIDHILFRVFTIDENFPSSELNFFYNVNTVDNLQVPQRKRKSSDDILNLSLLKKYEVCNIIYEVIKNKIDGIYPSDHFPLYGYLEY